MPVQVVVLRALRSDTGEAGMTVRSKSGTWVRIHGSRLGGSGDVAVVVDVATPDQLAPVRMAGYNLTTREQQVVDLVLRGRSTQQVADELFISQYTVQDRLKGIFEKVGVRSRRELVATIRVSELEPRIAANDERVRDGRPLRR
jgi:DNA-binding CsgD family transcriptional regulator